MPGSIPTPTLTWDTSKKNQAVAGQASTLLTNQTLQLSIKNALLGLSGITNTPTCKGSSSSVAAGMDAVDRWAAATNIVTANAGSAHSWFVFEFPGINDGSGHKLQMLWNMSGGQSNGYLCDIWCSAKAGFTGGSTTARPTATDEQQINGAVTTQFGTNSIQNWKFDIIAESTGKIFHLVMCFSNVCPVYALIAAPTPTIDAVTTGQPSGWDYPWLLIWEGTNSVANIVNSTQLFSFASRHLSRHGASALNTALEYEGGNFIQSGQPAAAANGITGQLPILGHGLWSNTAAGFGRLGYVPDLFFVSETAFAAIGSTIGSDDNHRLWFVVGSLLIPWTNDSTIPLGS